MEKKLQLQPHLAFLRQVKFCKVQQGSASWISSQNSSTNLGLVVLSHLKPYLSREGSSLPKLLKDLCNCSWKLKHN